MSLTRRLDERRHTVAAPVAPEHSPRGHNEDVHRSHHKYVGDFVYGGLDGIITTFAVVSGVAGADLSSGIVLILGAANLFADGFSMATGAYLSSKSEQEYYEQERSREAWQIDTYPDAEQTELAEIYRDKGYSAEDAETLVGIHAKDRELLLDAMMVHELNMHPDDRKPLLSAATTFVSFIFMGSIPLLVFVLGLFMAISFRTEFRLSIAMTAIALFCLGALKVRITALNWFRSGMEMLLVGGVAAAVAYMVGFLLRGLGG